MRLILTKARVSFAHSLFEGQVGDDGKISYNCHLLIPKGSTDAKLVMEAMKKAAAEKWQSKGEATLKGLFTANKVFFRKGDEKPDYEGYDGMMFLSVRTNTKPKLLNKDKTPVTQDQGTLYSGCYVYAILEVKAMDNKYGKRMNCYISGLMVVADGESLGGSAKATDEEFPDIADTGDEFGIGDSASNETLDDDFESMMNG